MLGRMRRARGLHEDDVANYTVDLRANEAKLWLGGDLASSASAQFMFYLSAIAGLWICAIDDKHTLATALASWCVFFIVDDWVIISEYAHTFQTPAMKSHSNKVQLFNLALLTSIPWALYGSSFTAVSIGLCSVLFLSALAVALFDWRARHLVEKSKSLISA